MSTVAKKVARQWFHAFISEGWTKMKTTSENPTPLTKSCIRFFQKPCFRKHKGKEDIIFNKTKTPASLQGCTILMITWRLPNDYLVTATWGCCIFSNNCSKIGRWEATTMFIRCQQPILIPRIWNLFTKISLLFQSCN